MANRRSIDPRIWQDENFGTLPVAARYLYLGFISIAEDDGKVWYIVPDIRRQIFPSTTIDEQGLDRLIQLICKTPLVKDCGEYLQIQNWDRYFFEFDPGYMWEWAKLKRQAFERDGYKCVYCGDTAKHLDHILARLKGGQDSLNNLVAACEHCNISKNCNDVEPWYKSRPFFDEVRLDYILSIARGD